MEDCRLQEIKEELRAEMKVVVSEAIRAALCQAPRPTSDTSAAAETAAAAGHSVTGEEGEDVDQPADWDNESYSEAAGSQESGEQIYQEMVEITQGVKRKREEDPDVMIANYQASLTKTTTGPKVDEKVAEICRSLTLNGLPLDRLKEIEGKYLPPENCDIVTEVEINPEISTILSHRAKEADNRPKKLQNTQAKAMVAIMEAMSEVKEATAKVPELGATFGKLMDAFSLSANLNRDRIRMRRTNLKYEIQPEYRHLCDSKQPYGKQLFGDDLDELVKTQTEANKLRAQIGKPVLKAKVQHGKINNKLQQFQQYPRSQPYQHYPRSQPQHQFPRSQTQHFPRSQTHQQSAGFQHGQSQPRGRGRGQIPSRGSKRQ